MYYKTQIKILKRDIKRKYGSISRFAQKIGVNEYELRKVLQRIENNRSKYAIKFNPETKLAEIKKLVYVDGIESSTVIIDESKHLTTLS